jgi:hypothetical protein
VKKDHCFVLFCLLLWLLFRMFFSHFYAPLYVLYPTSPSNQKERALWVHEPDWHEQADRQVCCAWGIEILFCCQQWGVGCVRFWNREW